MYYIFALLLLIVKSIGSSTEIDIDEIIMRDNYFSGLIDIETAVIFNDNIDLKSSIIRCSFVRCKSITGTCAIKLRCKKSNLVSLCFTHLTTEYEGGTANGGSSISLIDTEASISRASMNDVVHVDPYSHASLVFNNSLIDITHSNHSHGTMTYGRNFVSSILCRLSSEMNGSYCGFFDLSGGQCIAVVTSRSGNCHHFVFDSITSSDEMINNNLLNFYFDDCICINCGSIYASSTTIFNRWYFFGGLPPDKNVFINTLMINPFDLNIPVKKRCDIPQVTLRQINDAQKIISLTFTLISIQLFSI